MKRQRPPAVVRDRRDPALLGMFTLLIAAALWYRGLDAAALGFAIAGALMGGLRHRMWRRESANRACAGWKVFGLPVWQWCGISVQAVKSVDVRVETRGRGRHRRRVYAVYLGTQPRRRLWRPRSYLRARRYAEALARLFGVSFTDDSTGRVVKRSADLLDLSLGDRLRLEGGAPEYPTPSHGRRLSYQDRGRRKSLVLPRQLMPGWAYAMLILLPPLIVAIFWIIGAPVMVAGALLLTLATWWIGVNSLFPVHLAVDERGVRYRLFLIRRRIDWDALEELVMHRDTLYLIGDRTRLVLPYAFEDSAEARFVEALLVYAAWENAASSRGN